MTKAEIFMLAYAIVLWLGLGIYAWIQDDGHKKLVAKFVRFVESRKRRKLHKSKKR
jgi:hypothetical protein